MIYCCCIDKLRDRKGKINGYVLQDIYGEKITLDSNVIKNYIKNGHMEINNLQLSKDNRLIDRKLEHSLNELAEMHNSKTKERDMNSDPRYKELIDIYVKYFMADEWDRRHLPNIDWDLNDYKKVFYLLNELYPIKFKQLHGFGNLDNGKNPIITCGKYICVPDGFLGLSFNYIDLNDIRCYYSEYANDLKILYGIDLDTNNKLNKEDIAKKRIGAVIKFLLHPDNSEGTDINSLVTQLFRVVRKAFNNTPVGCKFSTEIIDRYSYELKVTTQLRDKDIQLIRIFLHYNSELKRYKIYICSFKDMHWKEYVNFTDNNISPEYSMLELEYECRENINLNKLGNDIMAIYRKVITNYKESYNRLRKEGRLK